VEYARERPLDAVVGVDDGSTLVASAAAAALALPHNEFEAVQASRDKSVARARFAAAGLPTPRHIVVEADADPSAILAAGEVRFPCVIKPIDLSSSQGVIRADDAESFETAFERVHAEGRLDAILGIEGSGGSSIVSTAMQALPIGISVGHSSMYGAVFRMLYKRA
jgi:glutathione synthase/RimK-type ligase-like ATP-grasp enzyme